MLEAQIVHLANKDGKGLGLGSFMIRNARLVHLVYLREELFAPGQKAAWKCLVVIPKFTGNPVLQPLKDWIKELMKQKQVTVPSKDWFVKDGDDNYRYKYTGHWVFNMSSLTKPLFIDSQKEYLQIGDFINNCVVNALIEPFVSHKPEGKRISAIFRGLQFVSEP